MWQTLGGDRVMNDAEWAVFGVGFLALVGQIEEDWDDEPVLSATGYHAFDHLDAVQKLAVLVEVAEDMRDPRPAPSITAYREAAVAGVFNMVTQYLVQEKYQALVLAAATSDRNLKLKDDQDADAVTAWTAVKMVFFKVQGFTDPFVANLLMDGPPPREFLATQDTRRTISLPSPLTLTRPSSRSCGRSSMHCTTRWIEGLGSGSSRAPPGKLYTRQGGWQL
jgi:hypothetical protein